MVTFLSMDAMGYVYVGGTDGGILFANYQEINSELKRKMQGKKG